MNRNDKQIDDIKIHVEETTLHHADVLQALISP